MSDRSVIFERFLDDVELYLTYKKDYGHKVRTAWQAGEYDTGDKFWEERDTLEAIRERCRRTLDEYMDSLPAPGSRTEPEPR